MAFETPSETPERRAFYDSIDPENMTALWSVMAGIITPEPTSGCKPHAWRYDTVREKLIEASALISAKEAERRVLILENPGLRGQSRITTSLYAGVQLVMPGEVAPAHRHSQSALRFVLESAGGETVVNGEVTNMQYGDFVITPHWQWHDHGNDTQDPVLWLDVLDIPIVQFFDASFAEGMGEDQQKRDTPEGDSLARYGANMLPLGYEKSTPASPIFNYPYDRSREALERMKAAREWDPCHGLKMRYVNPVNGDWAMPTVGTCLQLLPKGMKTAPYKSTDATGFVPVEGRGRSWVNGQEITWGPRDVFVVPSWHEVVHEPEGEAVLFAFSDRPIQEKLGLFREARGNA
ncbi:gentisate 1,2-dioxygenase [Chachezhania antarctica]|uniref:gentisate 1,2-dioxygenase n=1 Tax=Chachezhania antarctica TaxID=2340860 RepID=UPI000EB42B06|nr:gentisate 1,2-dioxygenase [Chachezhania antarctica]|tara:strand:- start:2168 stop:3214 length:1047 start_codon:yes stop_codon:yes gene_type:complete